MSFTFIKSEADADLPRTNPANDAPPPPPAAPLPPAMAKLVSIAGNRDPVFDRLAGMAADCVQELTRIQLEAQVVLLHLNQAQNAVLRISQGGRDPVETAALAAESIARARAAVAGWLLPPEDAA